MTLQELMRLELARRARIRAAVLGAFEITGCDQDRVRRREVATVAAVALGVVVDNQLQRTVRDLVKAMGAEPVKPRNKRFFRKMRRRA